MVGGVWRQVNESHGVAWVKSCCCNLAIANNIDIGQPQLRGTTVSVMERKGRPGFRFKRFSTKLDPRIRSLEDGSEVGSSLEVADQNDVTA